MSAAWVIKHSIFRAILNTLIENYVVVAYFKYYPSSFLAVSVEDTIPSISCRVRRKPQYSCQCKWYQGWDLKAGPPTFYKAGLLTMQLWCSQIFGSDFPDEDKWCWSTYPGICQCWVGFLPQSSCSFVAILHFGHWILFPSPAKGKCLFYDRFSVYIKVKPKSKNICFKNTGN